MINTNIFEIFNKYFKNEYKKYYENLIGNSLNLIINNNTNILNNLKNIKHNREKKYSKMNIIMLYSEIEFEINNYNKDNVFSVDLIIDKIKGFKNKEKILFLLALCSEEQDTMWDYDKYPNIKNILINYFKSLNLNKNLYNAKSSIINK